jgi:hypothetical protein
VVVALGNAWWGAVGSGVVEWGRGGSPGQFFSTKKCIFCAISMAFSIVF